MRARRLVLAALSLCACLAVNADDAPLQTLAGQIADGDHKGVTGMMVSRHGRVAAEVYPPARDRIRVMTSAPPPKALRRF